MNARQSRSQFAKNQNTWEGFHVLNALSFAPVPNGSFNSDVNASHCRRLTLALGFFGVTYVPLYEPMPENYQNTLFMLILAFAAIFTYRAKVQNEALKGECLAAFRLISGGATASFLYAAMLCYIVSGRSSHLE